MDKGLEARPDGTLGKSITMRVEWRERPELELQRVQHLHYQRFGEEVVLTFGQVRVPVTYAPPTDDPVPIVPVSRLAMSNETFTKFIRILHDQLPKEGSE